MTKRRIAVPALLAMAACAVPASANAAVLTTTKPCFGDGDPIGLRGTGFTPNSSAAIQNNAGLAAGTLRSLADGTVSGSLLPRTATPTRTQAVLFTGTDSANPANVGQVAVTRARLRVTVTPANASPRRVRRFRAFGFTSGNTLYRHILRGKRVSNGRMARLTGVCRQTSVRKRLFRRSAKSGTYRVQFDTKRGYSSRTVQRVRFRVRVFRTVRRSTSSSAAGGTGEVWTQLP